MRCSAWPGRPAWEAQRGILSTKCILQESWTFRLESHSCAGGEGVSVDCPWVSQSGQWGRRDQHWATYQGQEEDGNLSLQVF